jgi:BirA family transcriptional regulator, biotin operon repressor / biotin---[acetyl-CoA-carboxylase] ligase
MDANFDVRLFLTQLRETGCSLGEPFHYFTSTESTNDEAKRAASAGAPSGSTFLADHQTAGRGRQGRQWVADAKRQLLFSLLWRPASGVASAATTLVVGVTLHRTLRQLLPDSSQLSLKWPNDLESSRRKVAGILVESGVAADARPFVVLGVGVNTAPPGGSLPIQPAPLSLSEIGLTTPRETLLTAFLRSLEFDLRTFERDGLREFVEYLNGHHALTGETVSINGIHGEVLEVADNGALVLMTRDGRREVTSGSVERALSGE